MDYLSNARCGKLQIFLRRHLGLNPSLPLLVLIKYFITFLVSFFPLVLLQFVCLLIKI